MKFQTKLPVQKSMGTEILMWVGVGLSGAEGLLTIETLNIETPSIETLSIETPSIETPSIETLSPEGQSRAGLGGHLVGWWGTAASPSSHCCLPSPEGYGCLCSSENVTEANAAPAIEIAISLQNKPSSRFSFSASLPQMQAALPAGSPPPCSPTWVGGRCIPAVLDADAAGLCWGNRGTALPMDAAPLCASTALQAVQCCCIGCRQPQPSSGPTRCGQDIAAPSQLCLKPPQEAALLTQVCCLVWPEETFFML